MTVGGGLTVTSYTPGSSLTFNGSGDWSGASGFNSVSVDAGVTVTLLSNITTASVQVDDGATINLGGFQLSSFGNFTLNGTGTLTSGSAATLQLTGSLSANAGASIASNVTTVFAGAGQSYIPPLTATGNLRVNAGSTLTLAGALIAGSLDINGTLNDAGNAISASGAIDLSAGTFSQTGVLAATGTGARSLFTGGISFNAVRVSDTAVLEVMTSLSVTTTTIDTGATLRLSSGAAAFSGPVNLAGTLDILAETTFGGALTATSTGVLTVTSANNIALLFDESLPTTFPAGSVLTINPPGGTTVTLQSEVSGDRWDLINEGTITINNVTVSDSNASEDVTGTNLVDGGNNNGAWPFDNQGSVCTIEQDCRSGFCVDGICCESACGDGNANDCQGCSTALTGLADGLCTAVTIGSACGANTTECSAQDTCDAVGVCQVNDLADGTACSDVGTFCAAMDTCLSGSCVDGVASPCEADLKCVESTMECIQPCGDGELDATEECDEGMVNSDTEANACRTDCRNSSCGDGVIDTGETCDDADENSDDSGADCRLSCGLATCGDGILDPNEECDEGADRNMDVADVCRTTCASPACGDGIIDMGESCDDGPGNSDTIPNACGKDCQTVEEDSGGCGCRVTNTGDMGMSLLLAFALLALMRRRSRL